jgi:O-antigen/teichoic acid export membrane protein
MTGYISLMALGGPDGVRPLPRAGCRRTRCAEDEPDDRELRGLYLLIGMVAILIGAVLMVLFDHYEIPATFETEALVAFVLMVLNVLGGLHRVLPEGILFAHHDFVRRNLVRIAGILLRLGLTIGLLTLKASLVMLAAVQIACLAFDFSVTLFLIRRQYPEVRISLADFDFGMVRRIFSFSVYVLLLTAGRTSELRDRRPGDWRADGRRLDPVLCGRQQSHRLCDGLRHSHRRGRLPMATKLATEGKSDELREMFLKWSKVALSLTLMVGLFLIVFGRRSSDGD